MQHQLIVNGLDGPTRTQFGCGCGRCLSPERQAHTSVSLLSFADGRVVNHLLVDAGAGVVDSLNAHPALRGERGRLDGILLTHWHPDHTMSLNQLVVGHRVALRNRGVVDDDTMPRINIWCREASAEILKGSHAYDVERFWNLYTGAGNAPPGHTLPSLELAPPGLTITPVSVSHFTADRHPAHPSEPRYACAAFVLQTAHKKTVLLWDIDSTNEWLVQPESTAQAETVALLSEADHLLIDTAFWHRPSRPKTHPGFENVMRYARSLRPRETLLMHLSGHPDRPGNRGYGWSNDRWQSETRAAWTACDLPGTVRVPRIGDSIPL